MKTTRLASQPSGSDAERSAGRAVFVTTHWSLVLHAGNSQTPRGQAALATLCELYWFPLYAYVRRRGYQPHDAQDLTQEFFARLLAQQWLAQADEQRGKFRTFLLTSMSHFLANEWDKARAQKRGGHAQIIPLQLDTAETRYSLEPPDQSTPEQAYERRWALALLDRVLRRLGEEHEAKGKQALFEALKPCLIGDREAQPYAALASTLKLTESAVKVTVHRLRHRYRQLLREEIAHTVASEQEIDAELQHLISVLGR